MAVSHGKERRVDITNGIRVHLDREAQSVLYEPGDWSRCATDCMRHTPTHTIFKVNPDASAIALKVKVRDLVEDF